MFQNDMGTCYYVITIQVDSFDYRLSEIRILNIHVTQCMVINFLYNRPIHDAFHQANFNASVGMHVGRHVVKEYCYYGIYRTWYLRRTAKNMFSSP